MSAQKEPDASPAGSWKFKPDDNTPVTPAVEAASETAPAKEAVTADALGSSQALGSDRPAEGSLEWEYSESNGRALSPALLMMILAGAALLATIMYFVTGRDLLSVLAVVLATGLFVAYKSHLFHGVRYRLDSREITINKNHYNLGQFRAFTVVRDRDGQAVSIELLPLKRFMPLLTVRCTAEIEPKVVGILSEHLPVDNRRPDALDAIARRLKF